MSKVLYFLATFAESGLSVFGLRGTYDQPSYQVVRQISDTVELRHYAARVVVETDIVGGDEGQAFGRLFRYITGANTGGHRVAMTVPVERQASPVLIPMTVPVEQTAAVQEGGRPEMRFYLPPSVAASGPPVPTEAGVHTAMLPAATLAVLRYSGVATDAKRAAHLAALRATLANAHLAGRGAPLYLSYDPPFAIGFLRRNEVALAVDDPPLN